MIPAYGLAGGGVGHGLYNSGYDVGAPNEQALPTALLNGKDEADTAMNELFDTALREAHTRLANAHYAAVETFGAEVKHLRLENMRLRTRLGEKDRPVVASTAEPQAQPLGPLGLGGGAGKGSHSSAEASEVEPGAAVSVGVDLPASRLALGDLSLGLRSERGLFVEAALPLPQPEGAATSRCSTLEVEPHRGDAGDVADLDDELAFFLGAPRLQDGATATFLRSDPRPVVRQAAASVANLAERGSALELNLRPQALQAPQAPQEERLASSLAAATSLATAATSSQPTSAVAATGGGGGAAAAAAAPVPALSPNFGARVPRLDRLGMGRLSSLSAEHFASEPVSTSLRERGARERAAAGHFASDRLEIEELAGERVGAERFASERFSGEWFLAERLATERLATECLARETLTATSLLGATALETFEASAAQLAGQPSAQMERPQSPRALSPRNDDAEEDTSEVLTALDRELEKILAQHGWTHLEVQRHAQGLWSVAGATLLLRLNDGGSGVLASADGGGVWETVEEHIRRRRLQKVVRTAPFATDTREYQPETSAVAADWGAAHIQRPEAYGQAPVAAAAAQPRQGRAAAPMSLKELASLPGRPYGGWR